MLTSVLAEAEGGTGRLPAGLLEEVWGRLDAAARQAAAVGGWTDAEPLRLAKRRVTWLVRCPRRALVDETDAAGRIDDVVMGLIVDAAAKLASLGPRRPVDVASALAYLAASGDTTEADHLSALNRHDGTAGLVTADGTAGPDQPDSNDQDPAGALLSEAAERVDRLLAGWPAIEADWWPRVEDPVRLRLADGAVTVSGRLDIALGGPPSGRPSVLVEVKGGGWHDDMRADAHLYALLVALRDGVAPAACVTVVSDGTTQVEPIRATLLRHAGERLELALDVAARLAAGEAGEPRPGGHCGHCPLRAECTPGRRWAAQRTTAEAA